MLDADLEDISKGDIKGLNDYLLKWRNDTINELIDSLDSKASDGTSNALRQSIRVDVNKVDSGYEIEVILKDYYKFIDQGVQGVGGKRKSGGFFVNSAPNSPFSFKKGNKPSAKHFDLWSKVKGLNPFAVRESVFRKGIKPNNFYSDVINEKKLDDLYKNVAKYTLDSVVISIKNELDGYNYNR